MADDETPVRVQVPEEFYTQLGRFVVMFGLTESLVKALLKETAGISAPTALALFSGTRAAEATSLIRRCYEARGEALPAPLDTLLKQFIVLNNLRNDLLHHGVDFSHDPPVTTNARSVLNVKAVRSSVILNGTLEAASLDCSMIILGVSAVLMSGEDDEDDHTWAESLQFSVQQPWQYIPRAPERPRPDRPRKTRHREPRKPQQLPSAE